MRKAEVMRFGMVTTFYPPYSYGGDATYVRSLSRSLVELGHEVEVLASTDAYLLRSDDEGHAATPEDPGIKVHRVRHGTGAFAPLLSHQTGTPALYRKAFASFFAKPFDVLHFHNVSLMGAPGVLGWGRARVRLLSLHDHWLICPTHVLWKNRSRVCDRRTCLRCSIKSRLPPQLWRYTGHRDRSLEKLDRLLAPSQFTADMHRKNGVHAPIEVLPLFSSIAGAGNSGHRMSNRLLYVGRVTALKGVGNLARIVADMPDIELLVIGDGDLSQELQARYGDRPNIRFLGKIDQQSLVNHYATAAAVVVPTMVPETFGLTLVEAAACGTPGLVSEGAGGATETVSTIGGGLVYEGDAELKAAIRAITEDEALRSRLGAEARAGYETYYTKEQHLAAYLRHVEELVHRAA